jgi:hypothetical protein
MAIAVGLKSRSSGCATDSSRRVSLTEGNREWEDRFVLRLENVFSCGFRELRTFLNEVVWRLGNNARGSHRKSLLGEPEVRGLSG